MKHSILTAATAIVALTQFAPIATSADKYTVDPQHAWVMFAINHAGWSTAHGTFDTVTGNIDFDRDDVSASSVEISIDAASLRTGFADRDRDLLSPDFLNSKEFPSITFKSTSVEKTGDKTGKIVGDLTVLGVTKTVTLDAKWNNEAPLPWDAKTIKTGFSATASFQPAEFGMQKVIDYGLGPEVNLVIDLEAVKN